MRKQVQLDLGTPALSPTVQRAGQYNVAVQATPKTNSALQLAQALRRTPQVLGQASNIAKEMGAEAASSTMDVEGAMQDKESKGILGYNKAYQQGLVKRHFAMNEETIRERFQNVAGRTNLPTGATDEERMASINEFVSNLDEERDMFNQELRDMFGGDAHREQALQALSSVFVDGLYDDSMKIYKENLEQQTEMFISADASTMMKSKGVASGLDYAINEYKALGISPKERSIKLRGIVTADVAVLLEQGKLSQAESLLNEASTYNLHGNAKLFGSAEGKQEISKIRKSIRSAREKSEVSFADNSKGLGRSVDALLQDVADPDVSVEDRTASALRMAKRAGVSDEEAQAFAEAASAGGVDAMMEAYRDLARNTENEITRDLLNDQLGEINRAKKEYFGGNASTIGTFTADDISDLKAQREAILMQDPNTPLTQLPTSVNGRKMNVEDDDYKTLLREERRDFGWATSPSQLRDITRKAQKSIRGTATNDSGFGVYAGEYETTLKNDINAEAPALWRKANYDVAEYDDLLQKEADSLVAGYKRRAELRGSTETLLDANLSATQEAEATKEASKSKRVRDMASFSGTEASISDVINDRKTIFDLPTTGRGAIKSTDRRRLLQASLMDYGFPTMESFDLEVLSEANMGFEDVLLGDAVLREMIPAYLGYRAGDDATPEQKKAIEKWMDYGFDSLEDFNRLEAAQETLRNLNNR